MDIDKAVFGAVYRASMRAKGIAFEQKLDELMASQYLPRPQLEEIQLGKLRRLLEQARANVPHYRALLPIGTGLECLDDLRTVPYLTKETLKNAPGHVRAADWPGKLTKKTTAGSTGEPFSLWKTSESLANELAATWRGYSWANIEVGDRQCRFWGTPLKTSDRWKSQAIDFLTHRKRLSSFAFDEDVLESRTRELVRFNPNYFYGYVSSLVEYAKYIRDAFPSSPFRLKGIVTTSEVLTRSARTLLETTFGTKVYNEYGCAEFGTIAHECESGSLHVAAENMIVEVVDGDRICSEGEVGEFVVTELSNHAMPLIRYKTGDLGALSASPCPCGRALPVIESVQGRAWDMIERKDGKLFHPAFFLYIFEEAKDRNLGIEHYKVFQTDYDTFLVKVVPGATYAAESEAFIRREVLTKFDPDAAVVFEKVPEITRERSGKLRQVVGMKGRARLEGPDVVQADVLGLHS